MNTTAEQLREVYTTANQLNYALAVVQARTTLYMAQVASSPFSIGTILEHPMQRLLSANVFLATDMSKHDPGGVAAWVNELPDKYIEMIRASSEGLRGVCPELFDWLRTTPTEEGA